MLTETFVGADRQAIRATPHGDRPATATISYFIGNDASRHQLAPRLLSQMGYRADLATNGIEAIERIEHHAYDVVLMDVQMPGMDGLDASRQITTKNAPDARPRIVAMTANAMQGNREECLAAGMDDYLTKPIRVAALVEALMLTPQRKGR